MLSTTDAWDIPRCVPSAWEQCMTTICIYTSLLRQWTDVRNVSYKWNSFFHYMVFNLSWFMYYTPTQPILVYSLVLFLYKIDFGLGMHNTRDNLSWYILINKNSLACVIQCECERYKKFIYQAWEIDQICCKWFL
jgi:hypothetical protein